MLKLKKRIHELPEHHFETFKHLAKHLNKVAQYGDVNRVGCLKCEQVDSSYYHISWFLTLHETIVSLNNPDREGFENIVKNEENAGS